MGTAYLNTEPSSDLQSKFYSIKIDFGYLFAKYSKPHNLKFKSK